MTRWMVTIRFNQQPTAELLALIPAEQAHAQKLMTEGTLEALHVASDGSRVWLVMKGESHETIEEVLTHFPMHQYFVIEIVSLR